MKNTKSNRAIFKVFTTLVLTIVIGVVMLSCSKQKSPIKEIMLGGDDKVIILDYKSLMDGERKVNWEIKASDIIGLPDSLNDSFGTIADQKSFDGNKKLLICSSLGGVSLIDRKTKTSLFHAFAPMAHSVEYLPNDRIAVVLSTIDGGNSIEVYDAKNSCHVVYKDSLYSGHGITWNNKRKQLYALGYDELRAYALHNWDSNTPSLKLEKEWKVPQIDAHDLFEVSDEKVLISTNEGVWEFNLETEKFTPFKLLAKEEHVKSIYFDENTEQLIYTKGEIKWWSHRVHMKNPDTTIAVPEIDLYKARVIK